MASAEALSDRASNISSEINSEESQETSETEAIGEMSNTLSGRFCSDVWNYFTKCTNPKKALYQLYNKEYAYHGMISNL